MLNTNFDTINFSLSSRRTAKAASPQVYFFGVFPTEMYNLVGLIHAKRDSIFESLFATKSVLRTGEIHDVSEIPLRGVKSASRVEDGFNYT